MNILKILKKLMPDSLYFLLKKRQISKNKYFGLNNLDEKILKYLNYDNGYYVELGANDGISQSNTLYFELNRNWTGTLIEPVKSKFIQCQKIRSKRNSVFNAACVSSDYKYENIELIYSNLRTITNDNKNQIKVDNHLNSDDLNFYQNHEKFLVKAQTLTSILEEAKAPKQIDLLSIDTEGYEIEILKGLNFNNFLFKYILIETKNYPFLEEFLRQKGYRFISKLTNHDYLFKKI